MKIETKINFKEYLSWNMQMILQKPIIYIFPFAIIFLTYTNKDTIFSYDIFSLIYIIVILSVLIWTPIKIRKKIKNAFYTNKTLQELIIYDFSSEKIEITGETFQSEISWSTVFKITELKKWFLIYQSNNVVNLVPKKNFSQQQTIELRNLITQNNIKSKLRKD